MISSLHRYFKVAGAKNAVKLASKEHEMTQEQVPIVERFSEILIWPLELVLPAAHTVRQLAASFSHLSGSWEMVPDPLVREKSDHADVQYSEFVYFHPFVQRVL